MRWAFVLVIEVAVPILMSTNITLQVFDWYSLVFGSQFILFCLVWMRSLNKSFLAPTSRDVLWHYQAMSRIATLSCLVLAIYRYKYDSYEYDSILLAMFM